MRPAGDGCRWSGRGWRGAAGSTRRDLDRRRRDPLEEHQAGSAGGHSGRGRTRRPRDRGQLSGGITASAPHRTRLARAGRAPDRGERGIAHADGRWTRRSRPWPVCPGRARRTAVRRWRRTCSVGRPSGSRRSCAGWCSVTSGRGRWTRWCRRGWRRRTPWIRPWCDAPPCCSRPPPEAANLLVVGGAEALAAVGLSVGTPIQPMLAASAPGPADALTKSGAPAIVDVKLDGIRVQVHRRGDEVRVYTRSLDEITERLPEVVAAARTIAADELVLDGEVLALRVRRPTGGVPAGGLPHRDPHHRSGRAWSCGCSSSTCCTWTDAPCSTWD